MLSIFLVFFALIYSPTSFTVRHSGRQLTSLTSLALCHWNDRGNLLSPYTLFNGHLRVDWQFNGEKLLDSDIQKKKTQGLWPMTIVCGFQMNGEKELGWGESGCGESGLRKERNRWEWSRSWFQMNRKTKLSIGMGFFLVIHTVLLSGDVR